METMDILILGGGPAGLSTALHLAQLRPDLTPRILILEREHYPRPKLCGGGLVADAEILLAKLGLDVREIPHTDAQQAHFHFDGRGLTLSQPRAHTLRIIRRDMFDTWLAGKARERGIAIREGVRVLAVRPDPQGVTVETSLGSWRAKIVVGADGSKGVTRRCVLPKAPVNTARALEVLTPAPHNAQPVALFEFSPTPLGIAGYVWDFPTLVNGQPTRCWGIYDANLYAADQRAGLKETLAAELKRRGLELDAHTLQGHPIRWFDPFRPLCVPRVLLAGDAAGADPLVGEGISMALGYGKLAAAEIAAAFSRDDFSLTGYRRRVLMSPLGQTLVARWVIAQVIYTLRWRWFHILLWWILKPVVRVVAWMFVLNWGNRM
jgi:flavin-dependent dehydrogenase